METILAMAGFMGGRNNLTYDYDNHSDWTRICDDWDAMMQSGKEV
jgi:hypothetical protein